ncbi:tripartite tricarboxylate transporter TctB family protein [soil metagenome]
MKFNDAVWGAALVVFAGLLFVHATGFPSIPGQSVGPGAMPKALAVGLAVCGAILFLRGLRARAAGGARWVELPDWFASPPQLLGFGVLVAVNLLYVLGVERIGFVITGWIYLAALMLVLRVKPWLAIGVSLVMTLLIHYCFYKLLRVPLPWGVLQPIAW